MIAETPREFGKRMAVQALQKSWPKTTIGEDIMKKGKGFRKLLEKIPDVILRRKLSTALKKAEKIDHNSLYTAVVSLIESCVNHLKKNKTLSPGLNDEVNRIVEIVDFWSNNPEK
ncbi:hypothetical protein KJ780_03005 [Candidatus Micrarchaeota archaeon]|nr:hypothetical protein [Candidatus Micrarchaeota archaeon]